MKALVKQFARQITHLHGFEEWVIEQGIKIQQIPAPTFAEAPRADYVAEQFRHFGLESVSVDGVHNAFGLLRGQNDQLPGIMLMAHIDTVFPAETDLTIKRSNQTIYGPGLGDNSIGVAGMLGVLRVLKTRAIIPPCNLWFVATSREEGLGDLGGAKAAFLALQHKVRAVINLEGLAYGYVYRAGIAVRRLHITARTEGGHSWLHFGRPSATHGIVKLGAAIAAITPPETPRTTYNIGMLEGGQSINSIATQAGMWLDLRSESVAALTALENQVYAQIVRLESASLTFHTEVVGDRPAGEIPAEHPLVIGALAALEETGTRGTLQVGSTDGNIPLSYGVPCVTVGITHGGNAHRLDEYIETAPIERGLRHLVILTLAAAKYRDE
ncbi:MAG: M20/M25/M40 family metallo-hydrolase [Phototrophicaceae bacterium]|jgi:acetylornithine deacetylase/succinyl-diaminopimelate desuccinylase-like protein